MLGLLRGTSPHVKPQGFNSDRGSPHAYCVLGLAMKAGLPIGHAFQSRRALAPAGSKILSGPGAKVTGLRDERQGPVR